MTTRHTVVPPTPAGWMALRLRRALRPWDGVKIGPFGSALTLDSLADSGIPVFGQDNVMQRDFSHVRRFIDESRLAELDAYRVAAGDTLLTMMGSAGRCAVVPSGVESGVMDSHLLRLRVDSTVFDTRFLSAVIDEAPYVRAQFDVMSKGSIMAGLNSSLVKDLTVLCPPLAKQHVIADFLDHQLEKIDALIAKKRRLIELLQEKRTSMITNVVARGLDLSAPTKDTGVSSIGPIPAHWTVRRLRALSPSLGVGVVVNPSSHVTEEGVPFLYGSDVMPFSIDVSRARRISPESSRSLAQSMVHRDDLVMVRVGDPGVTAVVPPSLDGANCASMMIVRRSAEFDSEWLCYVMNSRLGRSQVEMVQYGAAQKQFNIGHAVDFRYPVPPLHEQIEMVRLLDHELDSLRRLEQRTLTSIDLSTEYRSALITAAVTGQVDVRTYLREPEEALEAS